jgi:putative DNA primase/helicase
VTDTPRFTGPASDGETDRASAAKLWPAPDDPMDVSRQLLASFRHADGLTLRHWRGGWMRWNRTSWIEYEDQAVRAWLYKTLDGAEYRDPKKGTQQWAPNRHKIADVLDALAATTHLSEGIDPPAWLDDSPIPAGEVVACTNGLLHVGTRKPHQLTPRFFNRVAVPFDWDPAAPKPKKWLEFLGQLWHKDPDSIAALQQFFGYVLSGRTDLHKIMLLIGPTRSGKGTIARVLESLIGKGNYAGPTLASLGTNFGLAPLLGKPLAVISDARLGKDNETQVIERLLSISGEDMLTIDRKYRDQWTGKLPSRFLIISNELPRFGDASGAIAHRFVVLTLAQSWLGKENPQLTDQLLAELPGILTWSLDGLDQLTSQGRFTEPASSSDAILALQDLVSPAAAFVRDHCTTGRPGDGIAVAGLYSQWKTWCEDNGHKPGTVQTFGRDLRAVVPQLRILRPRDGDTRERRYMGITLRSSTDHNGGNRGLSRTTPPDDPAVRNGPRPNPLWSVLNDADATPAAQPGPATAQTADHSGPELANADGQALASWYDR